MTPAKRTHAPAPATETPSRLTLLVGAESFLAGRASRRVLAAARTVDPDVERRDVQAASDAALGDLSAAMSPSLFGESAVVVVTGLADAPDPVLAALLAGLGDLADGIWVVAQHDGTRGRRGLDTLRAAVVPGGTTEIACAEVKKGRATRDLLVEEARRAGRRLTTDGADALALALGSNIALLVGALEQLMADTPRGPIDASVVSTTFEGVAEVPGFQLADALWDGHTRLALQRLRWGTHGGGMSGAAVTGALASGLRGMVRVAGTRRGISDAEVARAAGVPPFKVNQLRQAADGWSPSALGTATIELAALDAAMKGGLREGETLEAAAKSYALEAYLLRVGALHRP